MNDFRLGIHFDSSACNTLVVANKALRTVGFNTVKIGKKKMRKIPLWVRHIYNKLVIIIGFGIFYFEDFRELGLFLRNLTIFDPNGFFSYFEQMSLYNNLFLLIAAIICTFPILEIPKKLTEKVKFMKAPVSVIGTLCSASLLVLSSILLVDATTKAFLYYRF